MSVAEYDLGPVDEVTEYGLRTPNDEIIWPPEDYRGYDFSTPELREGLPHVLIQGAIEMKLDAAKFLEGFGWVPRVKTTTVVYKTLPTETSLASLVSGDARSPDQTPNDGEVVVASEGES